MSRSIANERKPTKINRMGLNEKEKENYESELK